MNEIEVLSKCCWNGDFKGENINSAKQRNINIYSNQNLQKQIGQVCLYNPLMHILKGFFASPENPKGPKTFTVLKCLTLGKFSCAW